MLIEMEEKRRRHQGRQVQKVRELLGVKQSVLAVKTKLSQQYISKLEQSEEIPDETLELLADGLSVPVDLIKNFDEEKAIYNIQSNITYHDSASNISQSYQPNIYQNPVDKVVELFEKLLKSEQEKVELLTKANQAILELSEQLKGIACKTRPEESAAHGDIET